MKLSNKAAEIFVPGGDDQAQAIARTTDLCIAAHQDDIEIMAYGPISGCYGKANRHFAGVVATDGGGSPRSGVYAHYTDDDMKAVRMEEQKNAALIGRYSVQILLSHSSGDVKDPFCRAVIDDIKEIIQKCAPDVLYTHNLADKHDTHVAVAMGVIRALRELPAEKRPHKIVSMEVWRSLDWLCDEDKTIVNTSEYPNLASALIGVFDSQISGGKRYDLATAGRRLANATFFASHAVDDFESVNFGLDITDLVNSNICPADFIGGYIDKFKNEVQNRILKMEE
ncbi:MAG: PIG-L family deacetylase [Defluviitaleaceae bacterium]|nr:PIG-L family deacetylase [Defluviitaleaceae bacterium]